jgi:DNA-binding NarL/FixJ family response regulator
VSITKAEIAKLWLATVQEDEMKRLTFIDDDETELRDFAAIIKGEYDYTPIHWPTDFDKLTGGTAPDIFVSDLYLPPRTGDTRPTPAEKTSGAARAREIAVQFSGLYANEAKSDKARLKETMGIISSALDLLKLQWMALGQHPDHGVEVLTLLKALHPAVPFVFYSRKITPTGVVRVLQAGAVDAIQKGALAPREVLSRLANAQAAWSRDDLRALRSQGSNANVTVIFGA